MFRPGHIEPRGGEAVLARGERIEPRKSTVPMAMKVKRVLVIIGFVVFIIGVPVAFFGGIVDRIFWTIGGEMIVVGLILVLVMFRPRP